MRRPLLVGAVTVGVWGGAVHAADTHSSARPPALEGRTGCELWVGTVSGNDPSVLVEALLCDGMDGAVTGQLQWSSLESGYSIRDVAGNRKSSGDLVLHDTKIAVSRPNPGWVFCPVDSYELTRSGDRLSGSYLSKRCNDRAKVTLTRKVTPAPPPAPDETNERAPDPPPAAESARAPARSACGCRSVAPDPEGIPAAGLALLSLALARRARSRAAR